MDYEEEIEDEFETDELEDEFDEEFEDEFEAALPMSRRPYVGKMKTRRREKGIYHHFDVATQTEWQIQKIDGQWTAFNLANPEEKVVASTKRTALETLDNYLAVRSSS